MAPPPPRPQASPTSPPSSAPQSRSDPLADQAGFPQKGCTRQLHQAPLFDELAWQAAAAQLGPSAGPAELQQAAEGLKTVWQRGAYHGPDPRQAERVAARQQAVIQAVSRDGKVPVRFDPPSGAAPDGDGSADASRPAATDGLDVGRFLRLLIIPVDFAGEDTAENFSHPVSMDNRSCVTETVTFKGPVHNEIAQPGPA